MGYAVKLDTNGTRPAVVAGLLAEGLLDYVALDYKAPPDKFKSVTGTTKFNEFEKTLALLCAQTAVSFEVRTTVHTALMDEGDVNAIIVDLDKKAYRGVFYIQNFRADNDRPTLGRLGAQPRVLDCGKILVPRGFSRAFRNFSVMDYDP